VPCSMRDVASAGYSTGIAVLAPVSTVTEALAAAACAWTLRGLWCGCDNLHKGVCTLPQPYKPGWGVRG
jgi:hypothetical protein